MVGEFKCGVNNDKLLDELECYLLFGCVLLFGLCNVGNLCEIMKELIEEVGFVVVYDMSCYLIMFGIIVLISLLMGLFGMVIGMIEIFGL